MNEDEAVRRRPDGSLLEVLSQILDEARKRNKDWQPAQGLLALSLYKSVAEVEKAYVAELCDIGREPAALCPRNSTGAPKPASRL